MTYKADRHPAKYSNQLIPVFAEILIKHDVDSVLDPFAGTGKIFLIREYGFAGRIEGIEIEPGWAAWHPEVTLGNALELPYKDNEFEAICVSPTYGNRMADHHNAKDGSKRNTYTHAYGQPLNADNSGILQWGEAYKTFHLLAWTEATRVASSLFVLNIKNHIRNGKIQNVTQWHIDALTNLGWKMTKHKKVPCRGNRFGSNNNLRIDYESVIAFSSAI